MPVGMTALQRECYKDILLKFYKDIKHPQNQLNLQRVLAFYSGMTLLAYLLTLALQKCVNHPYLYDTKYEPKTKSKDEEQRLLIESSGKLLLLHQMIRTLAKQARKTSMSAFL